MVQNAVELKKKIEEIIKEKINARLKENTLKLIVDGYAKEDLEEVVDGIKVEVYVTFDEVNRKIGRIATDADDVYIEGLDLSDNYALIIVNDDGSEYYWIYKIINNEEIDLIVVAMDDVFVENDLIVEDRYADYYGDISNLLFEDNAIASDDEIRAMLLQLYLEEERKEVDKVMEVNAACFKELAIVNVEFKGGNRFIFKFENGLKMPISRDEWKQAKSEWLSSKNGNK